MKPVYIVTSQEFINNPHSDDQLLLSALANQGISSNIVAWTDEKISWQDASLVLIRSTWDYCQNYRKFITWTKMVDRLTELWNPLEIIHWNSNKKYLMELQEKGIPVIPTVFLDKNAITDIRSLFSLWKTKQIVVKPIIGSNSFATFFLERKISEKDLHTIQKMAAKHIFFAQPYMKTVEDYGERSLVFINGKFAHAFRKTPFHTFTAQDQGREKEMMVYPSKKELHLAETIINRLKCRILFGRVDMVNDDNGIPRVIELELIEPRLNLHYSDMSLELLANTVQQIQYSLPGSKKTNSARNIE